MLYSKRLKYTHILSSRISALRFISRAFLSTTVSAVLCASLLSTHTAKADFTSSNSVADTLILQSQASRFLAQASMGGTTDEITALASRIEQIGAIPAFEEWIDNQFDTPRTTGLETQTSQMMDHDNESYRGNGSIHHWMYSWWSQAIQSEDQLRHKMAFALSQIFVVSMTHWQGLYRARYLRAVEYYDLLMDNAFSNHRDLLTQVTYSPMMGVYLSHAQNFGDVANDIYPDENYAREVMQLLSVGVFKRNTWGDVSYDNAGNLQENYTTDDVRELSEVFTGLSINDQRPFLSKNLSLLGRGNMVMLNDWHDKSTKILLDGTVLPAGQDGNTDISMALDVLAAHPSTAPYMSRLLIQRFTHSSPSRKYINRVAQAWLGNGPYGTGKVGDFKAILKAILLDEDVRNGITYVKVPDGDQVQVRATTKHAWRGKIKEPILKMTNFYRFAKPVSTSSDGRLRLLADDRAAGQEVLWAPTVFNFYDADYVPSDGPIGEALTRQDANGRSVNAVTLTSPESHFLGQNVVREFNRFFNLPLTGPANHESSSTTLENIETIKSAGMSDEDLIRYVDVMLCHGQLPYELAQEFANTLGRSNSELNSSGDTYEVKFAEIVSVIFASPACSVIM